MYCPKCGSEVGNYVLICPSCGELLGQDEQSGDQQNASNTNSGNVNHNYQRNQNYTNYYNQNAPVSQIPEYKVKSILLIVASSVLCCFTCISIFALPFAIIALVTSNRIQTHVSAGNIELAMEDSKKARMWCWVSFGIIIGAVILAVIWFVYLFTSGMYHEFIEYMQY
jgi:hypothetical protein